MSIKEQSVGVTLSSLEKSVLLRKQRVKQYVAGRKVRGDPAHREVVREIAAILDIGEDQAQEVAEKLAQLFYMNGVI